MEDSGCTYDPQFNSSASYFVLQNVSFEVANDRTYTQSFLYYMTTMLFL